MINNAPSMLIQNVSDKHLNDRIGFKLYNVCRIAIDWIVLIN